MQRLSILAIVGLLVLATLLGSCAYSHPDPYVRQGRRSGAAVGAISGAVIGNNVSGGNAWAGAAIGGAIGGLAGDRRGKTNSMYYGYGGPRYRYY